MIALPDPFALAAAEAARRTARRGAAAPAVPDVAQRRITYGAALSAFRRVVVERDAARSRRFAALGRAMAVRYDPPFGDPEPPGSAFAAAVASIAAACAYVALASATMVAAVRYWGG